VNWVVLVLALTGCAATPSGDDAMPMPCTAQAGTFPALQIKSGDETRFYFLHVPDAARCALSPLWIDFHGAAKELPEETYAINDAVAVADAEGVILLRPRSRSVAGVYRWDANDGDLDRNRAFVKQLVAKLEQHYAIDASRILISGFANGTVMASQYLRGDELPVIGIATIDGGFADTSSSVLARIPPHVYTATGFRDYMVESFAPLRDLYRGAQLGYDRWYWRQANTGHALRGWQLRELVPWLLRGERADRGMLDGGWTDASILTSKAVLAAQATPSGIVLGASEGGVFRGARTGWAPVGTLPATAHVTSVCSDGSHLFAVAETALFESGDDGSTWTQLASVPPPLGSAFGAAWLTSLDCAADRSVLGTGLWVGVESSDHAASWQPVPVTLSDGDASIATLARNAAGTAVAGGEGYLGRRAASGAFSALAPPLAPAWWNGIAAQGDHFWAVGDGGAIVASADDGVTWTEQRSPIADDFYAVAFADALTGAAVGQHGAIVVTRDGGASWTAAVLGMDAFLGAAIWLDAHTLLVAGEHGTVATRQF
jgi:poly(3-hydroxybutyrate) depolymerase